MKEEKAFFPPLAKPLATFPEFMWIWNHLQGYGTPDPHIKIANWLYQNWVKGKKQLLLMAFRACGKSTIIGLFCAWLLYCHHNLRILVLSAESTLATKMVRNVKHIIERHPLTGRLKPAKSEQWAADQFTIERPGEFRDPSMLARGIEANLTGIRADVIICDDVEVPNTCNTDMKRQELRTRLSEIDYILTSGGTQIYAGTPHSFHTIYAERPEEKTGEQKAFLEGFTRLSLPILNKNGYSEWPERYPLAKINALRIRQGEAKFLSQMMLRPVKISGGQLNPENIKPYTSNLVYTQRNGMACLYLEDRQMLSASAWWDPAFGQKKESGGKADHSVVACIFSDMEGVLYLHDMEYLTPDPKKELDEARQQCQLVARFILRNFLPSLTVEANGLGRFLPGLLRQELRQAKIGCAVIEGFSRRNKAERILEAFEARLAAGHLHAHQRIWRTPFITEMHEWQPIKQKGHDDGLDAVAGCLLSEPVRFGRIVSDVKRPSWQGHKTSIKALYDFDMSKLIL